MQVSVCQEKLSLVWFFCLAFACLHKRLEDTSVKNTTLKVLVFYRD